MTNAEAIEYIKKNCYGEWCEDDWQEAMDLAIKALESSSPCDLCVNNPPSSMDGKPCSYCPAEPTIDNM